jgi:acetoacetate decarboxylase
MSELLGFVPPLTPSGRTALVPPPPWHYSGDLLTVEYRTDPDRVRALLPAELEPAEDDPGAVAFIWADWQSCSDGGEELLDHLTRPMPYGRATARLEPGGRFGATLAAYDHRLATARLEITGPAESNGFVNALPMIHHRQVRAIERGAGWALDEVVTMSGYDAEVGPAWRGDAELELADSPWDEPASLLPVRDIIGGYFRQVGVSWNGGTTLARR